MWRGGVAVRTTGSGGRDPPSPGSIRAHHRSLFRGNVFVCLCVCLSFCVCVCVCLCVCVLLEHITSVLLVCILCVCLCVHGCHPMQALSPSVVHHSSSNGLLCVGWYLCVCLCVSVCVCMC